MAKYAEHEVTPFTGEVPAPTSYRVPTGKLGRQNQIAAQLLGIGYTEQEVAETTGLPITHLKVLLKSRLFRVEMDKARDRFIRANAKEVRDKVYGRAPHAVDVMEEIMDDPKHKDRLAAAKEFVGRVVPLKQEGGGKEPVVVINITPETLKAHETILAEYEVLDAGDSN